MTAMLDIQDIQDIPMEQSEFAQSVDEAKEEKQASTNDTRLSHQKMLLLQLQRQKLLPGGSRNSVEEGLTFKDVEGLLKASRSLSMSRNGSVSSQAIIDLSKFGSVRLQELQQQHLKSFKRNSMRDGYESFNFIILNSILFLSLTF